MTVRPSAIVGDALVLNAEGAAMVASALRLAARAAGRNGVDYAGRSQYDGFTWLLAQADLVAAGRTGPASPDSAGGTAPRPVRVTLPGSDSIWSTRQAAALLNVTRRAVVKAIGRGELPAERVGREWVLRETSVREYARAGREAR